MDSIQPTNKKEQIRPPPGIQREIIICGDASQSGTQAAVPTDVINPTQSKPYVASTESGQAHVSEDNVGEPIQSQKSSAVLDSIITRDSRVTSHDPVEEIRPPSGIQREVIVAGDSNVGRFARALCEEVGDHRSLEIILNRKATLEHIHELIDIYEERARQVPRMYILHVGVNNLLQGDHPDDIIESLRTRWTKRRAALCICSVPEIRGRGKKLQAETMLLNAKLKTLCKSIKARFIDCTRDLEVTNAFEKDGLHYRPLAVQTMTHRLGSVTSRFLGLRRRLGPREERTIETKQHDSQAQAPRVPNWKYQHREFVRGTPHVQWLNKGPVKMTKESGHRQVPQGIGAELSSEYLKEYPPLVGLEMRTPPAVTAWTGHQQGRVSTMQPSREAQHGYSLPAAWNSPPNNLLARDARHSSAAPHLPHPRAPDQANIFSTVANQLPHNWVAGDFLRHPPASPTLELIDLAHRVVCQQIEAQQCQKL
ncbi:hypothetical protein HPB47_000388 [Ixodes persulcatus]|uniref:Uncharacterized protein n=1 Tax=Ixodes persulcatus TaxID=34615 RepID=A0AC60PS56_IXOPE|nr:hypothetical protein HPB47_000388 [Ixodes persulcatus]